MNAEYLKTKYRLAGILMIVIALTGVMAGIVSAAGIPSPGDAQPYITILPANTDSASLNDAYRALNMGQRSFGHAMNAIDALRDGKVAGVDLSDEQKDAIKDQGFAGLYNARERYLNAIEILGVTASQLNAWELNNPQSVPCFDQGVATVGFCPTPVPTSTATPTETPVP